MHETLQIIALEKRMMTRRCLPDARARNASIHVSLVLMVAYAVCIAAYGIGRPELRQSVAFVS